MTGRVLRWLGAAVLCLVVLFSADSASWAQISPVPSPSSSDSAPSSPTPSATPSVLASVTPGPSATAAVTPSPAVSTLSARDQPVTAGQVDDLGQLVTFGLAVLVFLQAAAFVLMWRR